MKLMNIWLVQPKIDSTTTFRITQLNAVDVTKIDVDYAFTVNIYIYIYIYYLNDNPVMRKFSLALTFIP